MFTNISKKISNFQKNKKYFKKKYKIFQIISKKCKKNISKKRR